MRRIVIAIALLGLAGCALSEDEDPCAVECGEQGGTMTGRTCERCDGAAFCQCYDPAWWAEGERPGNVCQGIRYLDGCARAPWEVPGGR